MVFSSMCCICKFFWQPSSKCLNLPAQQGGGARDTKLSIWYAFSPFTCSGNPKFQVAFFAFIVLFKRKTFFLPYRGEARPMTLLYFFIPLKQKKNSTVHTYTPLPLYLLEKYNFFAFFIYIMLFFINLLKQMGSYNGLLPPSIVKVLNLNFFIAPG